MALLIGTEEFKQCAKYRMVFGSELGREVFVDMMVDLGFLSGQVNTPEAIALGNYARLLLFKIGAWQDHNVRGIIDKLFELPVINLEGDSDARD
jgi:hypothetical protein